MTGAGRLSHQAHALLRAVTIALAEHGIDAPPSLQLPKHHKVVKWQHVSDIFYLRRFEDEGKVYWDADAAKIKTALIRAGDDLINHDFIGRDSHHIWLTGKAVR